MISLDYLLDSDPFVEYATRLNILYQPKIELIELHNKLLSDFRIQKLLDDVSNFYDYPITNHKNPEIPLHKLIFLLDIGLSTDVPQIEKAINQILSHKDENGMYYHSMRISKSFGGTSESVLAWAFCDAPLLLYILNKVHLDYEKHIQNGIEYILGLSYDNGFPCVVSNQLGKFRGPGKKSDNCPYATLVILKMLSQIPEYLDAQIVINSIDYLFMLWDNSYELHPYMFFMGNDFRKLKAPTIWYDIINFVDILSSFPYAKKDKRFQQMLDIIENKINTNGSFTPESVYLKCSNFDFGHKKLPSQWLTYKCIDILYRNERLSF
ncbi:MAG: hypothetical protein PHC62_08165 [Candidatus Izemoplasmatales bacterium]|jgi:hypothetical protein|nr:hypothetical protein [Candidatus Izemoplasmatales bacterium]